MTQYPMFQTPDGRYYDLRTAYRIGHCTGGISYATLSTAIEIVQKDTYTLPNKGKVLKVLTDLKQVLYGNLTQSEMQPIIWYTASQFLNLRFELDQTLLPIITFFGAKHEI